MRSFQVNGTCVRRTAQLHVESCSSVLASSLVFWSLFNSLSLFFLLLLFFVFFFLFFFVLFFFFFWACGLGLSFLFFSSLFLIISLHDRPENEGTFS